MSYPRKSLRTQAAHKRKPKGGASIVVHQSDYVVDGGRVDGTVMNPIDGHIDEPAQDVVKVSPCPGGAHLPHGSINETVRCLREALLAARAENAELQRRLRLERDFR